MNQGGGRGGGLSGDCPPEKEEEREGLGMEAAGVEAAWRSPRSRDAHVGPICAERAVPFSISIPTPISC